MNPEPVRTDSTSPVRGRTSEQKAVARATDAMCTLDPDRTREQHERYVSHVVNAIGPYLVLRSLYDGVTRELHRERGVPDA
jgi:hypothetical protein